MGSMMNDDDGAFLKKVGTTHERDERKQFFFLLVFFLKKMRILEERDVHLSPLSLSFVHMNNGMNHHVSCTSHTL